MDNFNHADLSENGFVEQLKLESGTIMAIKQNHFYYNRHLSDIPIQ
jgi:hypothetical protein